MRLTKLSDNEVVLRLGELAKQSGVRLTYSQNMFYLSLLHYAEKHGVFDEETQEYYLQLSVAEFVEKLHSPHTTVIKSLKLLSDCGAIRRVKHKRAFRKITQNEYEKNEAYRTYMNVIYLQV